MLNVFDRTYITLALKMQRMKAVIKEMWEEEKGGTSTVVIEIVMVGLVLVMGYMFRKQLGDLMVSLWKNLVGSASSSGAEEPSVGTMSNPFE